MFRRDLLALIAATTMTLAASVPAIAQEATMPALPTPTESGFADVNGVKIWYQTYGEGDPLVLIHGGFGTVGCGLNDDLAARSCSTCTTIRCSRFFWPASS